MDICNSNLVLAQRHLIFLNEFFDYEVPEIGWGRGHKTLYENFFG